MSDLWRIIAKRRNVDHFMFGLLCNIMFGKMVESIGIYVKTESNCNDIFKKLILIK